VPEVHVPWKVSDPVSERLQFVQRWQDGERVVDLCREFGISRKTAYKILARYKEDGPRGLYDRSTVPHSKPNKTPPEVEKVVVALRRKFPTWGPKKLYASLVEKYPDLKVPTAATINNILNRYDVQRFVQRPRKYHTIRGAPLHTAHQPNDIWCADFKGQFKLGSGRYCYPLTISDRFSRFLIRCEALESTQLETAFTVFEQAFKQYGLPRVIRTDNGAPFAGPGIWGLTRLAVRWMRLGIWPERIMPGHPEQNGQHERMHLDLKRETTRPAGPNFLQQQQRFDRFIETYNYERPHEALGQRPPATLFKPSVRRVPNKLPELEYPFHDMSALVQGNGVITFSNNEQFTVSQVLGGYHVGLREVEPDRWVVTFMEHNVGYYDSSRKVFEPTNAIIPARRSGAVQPQ
jgi:transposase InsO family protein